MIVLAVELMSSVRAGESRSNLAKSSSRPMSARLRLGRRAGISRVISVRYLLLVFVSMLLVAGNPARQPAAFAVFVFVVLCNL